MPSGAGFSRKEQQRSRYRQLGLIGQGQFGRVFCAVHRQTGQLVALKNLERERFPTHKFLRELRFLLTLQHENIVTCQALEHTATGRYLVMDYCEGGTLRSLLDEEHRLHPAQSLKLVADMLAGLEHAHSQGIVHCDVKPENILLSVEQWGWTARISDFGIARLRQELAESPSGGNTGSPAYMAPERFYGQYSPAADLYSVGILLFELLAGYRPFSGTPTELMSAHLNRPLVLPDSIPAVFHPLLSKALQKLAARRFRNAGEMGRSLVQAATDYGLGDLDWGGRSRSITLPPALPTVFPVNLRPVLPWRSRSVVSLENPIAALAIAPKSETSLFQPFPEIVDTYRASGDCVTFQRHSTKARSGDSSVAHPGVSVCLPQPIRALQVRPQGCFAIAAQSVYLLSPPIGVENQSWHYRAVAQAEPDSLVAIEPSGRWLAIASALQSNIASALQSNIATITSADGADGFLTVQPLPNGATPLWTAPRPVQLPVLPRQRRQLLYLAALDGRHLVLVSEMFRGEKHLETWIEVFNRRGDRLGCLTLPVRLGCIISAPDPYRLVACDAADPNALLMIDLKPFRVVRLGIEIVPKFLAAANWGYVLASEAGELLLLDDLGQRVGRFQAPAPPVAIALFAATGLLLATQTQAQSQIHLLDLKEMDTDLLF
jgi:serine/threonine protein kinase